VILTQLEEPSEKGGKEPLPTTVVPLLVEWTSRPKTTAETKRPFWDSQE
jgi:hypothetical protein